MIHSNRTAFNAALERLGTRSKAVAVEIRALRARSSSYASNLGDCPNMIRDASFHGWRHSQRSVNADEVVPSEVLSTTPAFETAPP